MALFGALDAAVSGATVSRVWLDTISDNVANVNTIRATDEEPFRARMLVVNELSRQRGQTGSLQAAGANFQRQGGQAVQLGRAGGGGPQLAAERRGKLSRRVGQPPTRLGLR